MKTTALQLLSILLVVSAVPIEEEVQMVQHALGLNDAPSKHGPAKPWSVQSRYQFEVGARNEVSEYLDQRNDLDVWQLTSTHVDIHSQKLEFHDFPDFLTSSHVTVQLQDQQRIFADEIPHYTSSPFADSPSSLDNCTFHDNYRALDEIDMFIKDLASAQYAHATTSLVDLGHTAEGREMYALRIASKKSKFKKTKRALIIAGAQHAREWIATATTLYIAHAIVLDPSSPDSLAHLLDDFDLHIIPLPNPDGYLYTWKPNGDRFWYKNRMILSPDERCQGVDMNRNWGYEWSPLSTFSTQAAAGIEAPDPCSPLFPGHRPFEAPEVNNIANYIMQQVGSSATAFLELRSYGQMISAPFSHSCAILPSNAEDLFEAALNIAHAVKKKHGSFYSTGSLCSNLYAAPGNILDWMYGEAGVPYSFSVHLGDTGTYGYALPPRFIRPMAREAMTMIRSLADFVLKHPVKFDL